MHWRDTESQYRLPRMTRPKGIFIQIDGIDGAGKSTAREATHTWFAERRMTIFDTVAYASAHRSLPTLIETSRAQVLFTGEPTHAWTGAAIRDEIIRTATPYSAKLTAQAYAIDRAVQHVRLTRPFLNEAPNQWVIQDRGFFSSLAYQTLQSIRNGEADPVSPEWLLSLEGNRITFDRPPDMFIFLDVAPETARKRLAGHEDNHRFEGEAFQMAVAERYRDPMLRAMLEKMGTHFVTIDASRSKDDVAADIRRLLEKLASN